jgi:tetrapyrrole methylase family protein/MazG family protein
MQNKEPLYRLKEIARILRSDGGCPWDREQTFSSLKQYLIEEAYEVYDAIDSGDMENLREELGDLLYQVYAHSVIAEETGAFNIDDVANGISDKLIRRHPHVFGNEEIADSKGVRIRWENIKKSEKTKRQSILDGVPRHLPALTRAYRIQEKVSNVGFDWEKTDDAVIRLDEEVHEFKEAVKHESRERIAEEAGDILFSMVNVLRFKGIDPEDALRTATDKFMKRFKYIERECAASGQVMNEMSLAELDRLWEKAKGND